MKKQQQLDYPNTCPIIDKAICEVTDSVREAVIALVGRLFPILDELPYELEKMAHDTIDDLMQDIERQFEVVRNTNEDMRCAADEQLSSLCDDLYNLESEIQDVVEGLHGEIDELRQELS